MATLAAELFDGESAASRNVAVQIRLQTLEIADQETRKIRSWSISGLEAVEKPVRGQSLRLTHENEKSARLILPASPETDGLVERTPHLQGGFRPRKFFKGAAITATSLALVFAIGYGLLNLAPKHVAKIMPDTWRERLADQTEAKFLKRSSQCKNTLGTRALHRLASRVIAASDDPPDFSIRVFNYPLVNAFALPGGRIVLTSKLIEKADSPEEVAGVVAHELGHVANRHPEAALIRIAGIQLLFSIATGGSGGDTLGGVASILTLLRYSRKGEREADRFAHDLMTRGKIDPAGLKAFFKKIKKLEGKSLASKMGGFSDMLSTHPGTDDRIKAIKPLPPGEAREVMDDASWAALKAICT